MNRRKLFSFLAVSPVAGVAAIAKAQEPPVKRIDFERYEIVEESDTLHIRHKNPGSGSSIMLGMWKGQGGDLS